MPEYLKNDLLTQLRQELHLTPQLLQSMEVLQMNTQELLEYLNRAAEENPMLERAEPAAVQAEYRDLCRRISWLDASGTTAHRVDTAEGKTDSGLDSLDSFLRDQLSRLRLPREMDALCQYMVQLLDDDGYLPAEEWDGLQELGLPHEMVQQALTILQTLEPAGVAARELAECLELQLKRQGEKDRTVLTIVRQYLPQLGKHHYGTIARALHISEQEVRQAQQKISALQPYPGRAFQSGGETEYVRPDLFVAELDGRWQVLLNEYYLPRLTVSGYYAQLINQTTDPETLAYLRKKLHSAQEVLQNLERRGDTLRRCAEAALVRQTDYFTGKSGELQPMSMRELAQELEVHPSTVSRALRGKYLQCRQGTYPLRYFFPLCGGGVSRQAVQKRLVELIGGEDRAKPLSDEKLRQLLAQQGVEVARRTVAKYREELRIPAASARRKR